MIISKKRLREIIRTELINEHSRILAEAEDIEAGTDVFAKWDGKEYEGTLVEPDEEKENEYYIEWNSGEFNWVPKEDVRVKPFENPATPSVSFSLSLGEEILWKVLADEGKSKNWDDLISLDGGTVGIAHFAAGGIGKLYDAMDDAGVNEWFGGYNDKIDSVQALKDATKTADGHCRLGSKSAVRGTCWTMPWWKKGMKKFLASGSSKTVQLNAWIEVTAKPANELIDNYASTHSAWTSKRGRAIAYSLVNSGGQALLIRFSENGKLTPNDTMDAYNKDKGRVRARMLALNRLYPDPSFKPENFASKFA
jgi:hypothetical protein